MLTVAAVLILAPGVMARVSHDLRARRGSTQSAQSVSVVTLPMLGDPGTLNPLYARDVYAREVAALTEPTLLLARPNGGWAPYLATRVQVRGPGQTLVFTLNPRARWSNGRAITAQDVVASLTAAASPALGTAYGGVLQGIVSVRAVTAHAVQVRFSGPTPDAVLRVGLVPIVPAEVVTADANRVAQFAAWNPVTVRGAPVGGPYRVVGGNLASGRIIFARRAGFWLSAPGPSRVILQYEVTTAVAWNAFLHGALSAVVVPSGVRATLGVRTQSHVVITSRDTGSITLMAFNLADPLLASPLVREAVRMAIPSARLAREANEVPMPLGPEPWSLNTPLAVPRDAGTDVSRARALLRDAGWQRVPTSPFLERGGSTLAFTCLTVAGVPSWDRLVASVAQSLAKVGIDMNVTYVPFRVLTEMLSSPQGLPKDVGAYALAYTPSPGAGVAALYGGPATFPPAGADAGHYSDGAVTRLLWDAETASSTRVLPRLALHLAADLAADPPAVFFGAPRVLLAVQRSAQSAFLGQRAWLPRFFAGEGIPL